MRTEAKKDLHTRVVDAAERALADHHSVSPIDILIGIRLLEPAHVEAWRKGRLDVLQPRIQGSPEKIQSALRIYWQWAQDKGLRRWWSA